MNEIFVPVTKFELKLGFPVIYPFTKEDPFIFTMRIQMVSEADDIQRSFLMLSDADRISSRHKYDADMISHLCVEMPTGFPGGIPEVDGGLRESLLEFFYPDEAERRDGMAFICRQVMAAYWAAVQPADYL